MQINFFNIPINFCCLIFSNFKVIFMYLSIKSKIITSIYNITKYNNIRYNYSKNSF